MGRTQRWRRLVLPPSIAVVAALCLACSAAATVSGEVTDTCIWAANAWGTIGESVTIRAVLRQDTGNGWAPLPDQPVTFWTVVGWGGGGPVLGEVIGSDQTDPGGLAETAYAIPGVGLFWYAAVFDGTSSHDSCMGLALVTGTKLPTCLTADNVIGYVGKNAQLRATLTSGGSPLSGKTVRFTIGLWTRTALTDNDGVATVDYPIGSPGAWLYEVKFAGDATHEGACDLAWVTGLRNPTTLVADDVWGYVGQSAQFRATLTADGSPLPGRRIVFERGSWRASATTGPDGVAQVSYPIAAAVAETYAAHYDGGFAYAPSCGTATVAGVLNPTTLQAADASGNVGQTVQLTATLTGGGEAIVGAALEFTIDAWSVSATTDDAGVATVPYTIPSMGDKHLQVSYAGTGYWAPSTDDATVSVYNNVTTIGLFLSANPIVAGRSTTATVVDKDGNIITGSCSLGIQSGAGGAWAGSVYTSEKAGDWRVTAAYGPYTDSEVLTVTHARATGLDIGPNAATITTLGSQAYTATATDEFGNAWVPDPVDVTWSSSGAGAFGGATYAACAADGGKTLDIQGTLGSVASDTAKLTVYADGPGLILAWDKDTRGFYLCGNPANPSTGLAVSSSGAYIVNGETVTLTVAGPAANRQVCVNNSAGIVNKLQVRYYLRSGSVLYAYMYSTIGDQQRLVSYRSEPYGPQTLLDDAYKAGFWGVFHTLDAADPSAISYGVAEQP